MVESNIKRKHPAVYSQKIIDVMAPMLEGYERVLDPFAGTGKIHLLSDRGYGGHVTVGVEIEPEWAEMHPKTIVGDATKLPFPDMSFDAICTSPTFGNRFADHHNPKDKSVRRSYKFDLGRDLHPNNSGQMHWGFDYQQLHLIAWAESYRVLRPGGVFVLNMKDHIKGGVKQNVMAWHISSLVDLSLKMTAIEHIQARGMKYGANRNIRVTDEFVLKFEKNID